MSKEKLIEVPTQEALDALKSKIADELVTKCNEISQDGTVAELKKATEELEENINKYTALSKSKCFTELAGKKNPMLAAVKMLNFESIKTKNVKIEGTKMTKLELVEVDKPIDLAELHKFVKDGIGSDKNWVYMVERLNMLFTARVVKKLQEVGSDVAYTQVNESYAMMKISSEMKLHEEGGEFDPLSDENLLQSMQMVVTAMVGKKYLVSPKDLAYLEYIYAKKGKTALKVSCANHKNFRRYIAEICNRIVTNSSYDADWKIKKQD